ncbi:MAG TPA: DUF932 domain-containing protein, partial [Polyangiaceae bacterium]|nr:DUF932 domain-containing protein [Polyangiaceae bacterium]
PTLCSAPSRKPNYTIVAESTTLTTRWNPALGARHLSHPAGPVPPPSASAHEARNIRLTFPSEAVAVKPGDISHVGLDISSSSFGRSAVHIRSVIWRLVCTNGVRMPEGASRFSFRHVGDADRLQDGIGEAIPVALAHARGTMGRWRRAVTVMVDRVAELVANMRDLTGLERSRIRDELQLAHGTAEVPERTDAYNLVNAITAAAHDAEPARRLELESFAGRVLHQQVIS